MKVTLVDWSVIHARLVRTGWAAGWGAGLSAGGLSLVWGSSADLAALRAGVGLVGFIVVAIVTGLLLGRLAPSAIDSAEPKGTFIDQVVGGEPDEAEPEPTDVTATPAEDERDAA